MSCGEADEGNDENPIVGTAIEVRVGGVDGVLKGLGGDKQGNWEIKEEVALLDNHPPNLSFTS